MLNSYLLAVVLVLSLVFAGGADCYARSEDNDERVVSDNVGSEEKGNLQGSANASESESVKALAEWRGNRSDRFASAEIYRQDIGIDAECATFGHTWRLALCKYQQFMHE
ncbi:MAG: hypothetical protein K2M56_05015 [Muribaculaceae bacterium]|nr:hypothetical protein [Muribaculaceae bacterium]